MEDLVRENVDINGKRNNQDKLHDENKKQSQKYGQCKTGSFFGKLPEPPKPIFRNCFIKPNIYPREGVRSSM